MIGKSEKKEIYCPSFFSFPSFSSSTMSLLQEALTKILGRSFNTEASLEDELNEALLKLNEFKSDDDCCLSGTVKRLTGFYPTMFCCTETDAIFHAITGPLSEFGPDDLAKVLTNHEKIHPVLKTGATVPDDFTVKIWSVGLQRYVPFASRRSGRRVGPQGNRFVFDRD